MLRYKCVISLFVVSVCLIDVTRAAIQTQIVTILSEPFVMKAARDDPDARFVDLNGGYKGILIDLLWSFLVPGTDPTNADVQFKVVQAYGHKDLNGKWAGLVGEVNQSSTAFGLGDITINSERLDAVHFTVPFLTTGLTTVSKGLDFVVNYDTLPELLKRAQDGKITIGCRKNTAVEAFLRDSDIPIYRQLYQQMKKSDDNFVETKDKGIAKVRDSSPGVPFVYFEEKATIQSYIGQAPCDLSTGETLNTVHYALVFNKGQTESLTRYNKLIADYLASGKMDVLLKKWYKNQCREPIIGGVQKATAVAPA
jgi:hypothetical protein